MMLRKQPIAVRPAKRKTEARGVRYRRAASDIGKSIEAGSQRQIAEQLDVVFPDFNLSIRAVAQAAEVVANLCRRGPNGG